MYHHSCIFVWRRNMSMENCLFVRLLFVRYPVLIRGCLECMSIAL
jgi:hypothetical protein